MKLVTFNIRCDWGEDGRNNFCFRRDMILETLDREKPDVICFQEVRPHVAAWLKERLGDYYVIGCGRGADLTDEQVSIAYRRDRINLIEMETFWLSETPHTPGSRYPDQSICPRTATEAVFENLEEKYVFRVVNTHLDHESAGARAQGLRQILEKLERAVLFPGVPTVIAGDMNAEADSPELAVLGEFPYRNETEGTGVTYHGFGQGEPCGIDCILTRGFVCEGVAKWTEERDGVYLSDHYPVCAVLRP